MDDSYTRKASLANNPKMLRTWRYVTLFNRCAAHQMQQVGGIGSSVNLRMDFSGVLKNIG